MAHTQVSVSNNGTTTIKRVSDVMDVPMPSTKRTRDASTAKYDFNKMTIGKVLFASDEDTMRAMTQAFKSKVYAPAQALGKLSVRNMDKYPDMKRMYGLPDGSYGLWLVAHKPKEEKA